MSPLEKLINTVRIAPHGIIPAGVAIGLGTYLVLLGSYNDLPLVVKSVLDFAFGCSAALAIEYAIPGIKKYESFKKEIANEGLIKRNVEYRLKWYCERQAYKAAAYSLGFGKKFDEINRNYTGEKKFTWVPEI
ncbi:MAG: hypothetical protein QW757_05060 [Candidatus Woesearchaeota archaeon]